MCNKVVMNSKIVVVDNIKILDKGAYPRVVNYTATWCGPCRKIAPFLDQLSIKYTNVHFFKVDIDEHADHAMNKKISSVPTFYFYKDILSEPVIVKGANEIAILKEVVKLLEPKY